MVIADLRAHFGYRGFGHLPASLQDAYLNYSYQVDVCEDADWPFLEATSTGASPLTISDLDRILRVVPSASGVARTDLENEPSYTPVDRRQVGAAYLSMVYYLDGPATIVAPEADTDLTVLYRKTVTALSDSNTTPIFPDRFHLLVVDGAVVRAYERANEWDNAAAARNTFQFGLQQMREALLGRHHDDAPQFVEVRNATDV